MGLFTSKPVHARHRHGQNRPPNPAQTGPVARPQSLGFCCGLRQSLILALTLVLASTATAETTRIATYNVSLGRDGPGLFVRDLLKGKDKQIAAVVAIITKVRPDILLLNDFDYDHGKIGLNLFADHLAEAGINYPYRFALPPNSTLLSDIDLDGDGRLHGPGDRQGFGMFAGAQGMALLSRYPIDTAAVQDFSDGLWKDLPGANLPVVNGRPWPSQAAWNEQRLSSKGHWDVPITLPDGQILHVLAAHASPPIFDGDEDQNGRRNRGEIRFWTQYLTQLKDADFVILGDLNADPNDGEGSHGAIRALLTHPLINDVLPGSNGAIAAAKRQAGPNLSHTSNPAQDSVDWQESRTPGNMRVDYVLPSANLKIAGAGVFWPAPDEGGFDLVGLDGDIGSHHRLVWVDIIP